MLQQLTGHTATYPRGVALFRQGDPPGALFLIHTGVVMLTRAAQPGAETIAAVRRSGWLVGGASIGTTAPHVVTATTATRCEVRRMEMGEVTRALRQDLALSEWLRTMLAAEVRDHVMRQGESTLRSVDQVCGWLTRLIRDGFATPCVAGLRLQWTPSQQELAQMLGVCREHANRSLRTLAAQGVIVNAPGGMVIPHGSPILRALRDEGWPGMPPAGRGAISR